MGLQVMRSLDDGPRDFGQNPPGTTLATWGCEAASGQRYHRRHGPRRYRLRLLNGSQARFYNLHFRLKGAHPRDLPFWVIGSEGGLLPAPAKKFSLLIAPGERFDAIVDFTGIPMGSTVMMTNDAPAPYPMGDPGNDTVPELMKIRINTRVPANDPDLTVDLTTGRDPAFKPDLDNYLIGPPIGPDLEEMGYKDTVKAYPNMDPNPPETYSYVTRTRASFALQSTSLQDYNPKTGSFGNWVYHCHILEHEENDMMRPFVVVR